MSGAYFQSIVSKLVVNPTGMDAGLAEGEKKAKTFAARVKDHLGGSIGDVPGLGSFGSAIDGAISKLGKLGSLALTPIGMSVTAAVAAGVGLKRIGDDIDEADKKAVSLEKSARRLGLSLADRGAFDVLVGIDRGEELAQGLGRFNRMIGEAKNGGEGAIKVMDRLGLSVEKLSNMTKGQQIEAFAKAIAGIKDIDLQSSLISDVMGRSGIDFLNAIKKIGTKGLGEARDFAVSSGYVPTADQVAQGYEDEERLRRQEIELIGLMNKSAKSWRWLDEIADDLGKDLHSIKRGWSMTKNGIGRLLASPFDAVDSFDADLSLVTGQRKLGDIATRTPQEQWADVVAKQKEYSEAVKAATKQINAKITHDASDDITKWEQEAAEANKKYAARIESMMTPMEKLSESFAFAASAFGKGDLSGARFATAFGNFESGLGLSARNPVRSTLAGAVDVNSFAGAAALQAMVNKSGGGLKTDEERAQAIVDAVLKGVKQQEENVKASKNISRIVEERLPKILQAPNF